jgi:hypothetical protein
MDSLLKLIPFIALVYAIRFSRKIAKSTPEGTVNSESLTGQEKLNVWLLDIVNPILHGAIFYFSWRKKLPTKAKQANKISFIVFCIEILVAIALVFFLNSPSITTTTSPSQIISYHSDPYQFTVDFPRQPNFDKSETEAGLSASYTANRRLGESVVVYYVNIAGEPRPFTFDDLQSISKERVVRDFGEIEQVQYTQGKVYRNYTGANYEYKVRDDNNILNLKGMIFIEPKTNRVYDVGTFFDEAQASYMATNYPSYLSSFSLQ